MKQTTTAPIRTEEEFGKYMDYLEERVADWRENEGMNNNMIRCRLIGHLTAESKYALTCEQLDRIFELGFGQ